MLFPEHIGYTLGGGDFELPRMFKARQLFCGDKVDDVAAAVRGQFAALQLPDLKGKRVALTGGSRGVANQALILKTVAACLTEKGAKPFIVPGMGSHAGATAEGQKAFLAGYGITEEYTGVPILATMDAVHIGTTPSGFKVHCDQNAFDANFIMPVHRVKPHTDFKGEIESGLCKMLVIGLGKHKGATIIHNMGFSVFASLIPEAAQVFFDTGKILAGMAVVENGYDETMIVEAIPTENIIAREKALLRRSKDVVAKFHTDKIDLLIVEEIGKDISGTGMDSNVTGHVPSGEPGFETCPITRIAVLGLSEKSHGNGIGMGCAHVVTNAFVRQLDPAATYINNITARNIEGARLPLVANTEKDAVRIGLFCSMVSDPSKAKVVQVANTLLMGDLLMSEAYLPLVQNDTRFQVLSDPEPMNFDKAERLMRLPRTHT